MTWDIYYDDGDEGIGLCRECVRPYVPYAVQESIEVRVNENAYAAGRVVAVHHKDKTFDVKMEECRELRFAVRTLDLRRRVGFVSNALLTLNARVLALFLDGESESDEWYPGVITEVGADGTFAVLYDDGDFAPILRRHHIKVLD